MKVRMKVIEEKEFNLAIINYMCHVRYWDDASFNGVEDCEEGELNPFNIDNEFNINIDVYTGQIKKWPKGLIADIHYKTCDRNCFSFHDNTGLEFLTFEDEYVPNFMPEDHYGDCVILKVDGEGIIKGWNKNKVIEFIENQEVE